MTQEPTRTPAEQAAIDAFAARLRMLRVDRGLTQYRLAKIAGVRRQLISKLERGVFAPGLFVIAKMVIALDVSPADLLHHAVREFERDS